MKPFHQRALRICFLDLNSKVIDQKKMLLEERLKFLGSITAQSVRAVDDPKLKPCDLLVIDATYVPDEEFENWISGLGARMIKQGAVWIPALIVADAKFQTLKQVLLPVAKMNWYFDIIAMDHIDSLPIRVANLLRIHDHLHELDRYQKTLDDLSSQVDRLNAEVISLKVGVQQGNS
jgi:hypothetical protein